jgi:predicted transcriptional regulator
MNADGLRKWRKAMDLTQKDAAALLGLSEFTLINYEAGHRRDDGSPVVVPKYIALACAAIAEGITEYDGPEE